MPYARRTTKKTYRRRRPAKSGYVRKVARTEARRAIKRTVETKSHDEAFVSTISTGLSTHDICSTLLRGTGDSNFIGAKITPTYLSIKYTFIGADPYNIVRMIILQDKASSGTPALATLFENTSYPLVSGLNNQYRETYRLLADRRFVLKQFGSTYFAPTCGSIRIPMSKLRQVKYTDAGNNQGGKLWIVLISDSSAVSHPSYQIYTRLYFKDA